MRSELAVIVVSLVSAIETHWSQGPGSGVVYLDDDNLTAPERVRLAMDYLKEMMAPMKSRGPNYNEIIVIDKKSFLLDRVANLDFGLPLRIHDLEADFDKDKDDDIFKHIVEKEFQMDAMDLSVSLLDCFDQGPKIDKDRLEFINRNVFSYPRQYKANSKYRNSVGDYISRKFASLGLVTGFQQFTPTQFLDMYFDPETGQNEPPSGSNIFAVYPGKLWGTPEDKLLIVAAHWDTFETVDGFNDNGSGVSGVLEVARAFVKHMCVPKYSIIFATFDLEEVGIQGSFEFVNRYLIPKVIVKFGHKDILGAFIIDTALNFNETVGSQTIRDDVKKLLPESAAKMAENGSRGNFIELMQRRVQDEVLGKAFENQWTKVSEEVDNSRFRLIRSKVNFDSVTPQVDEVVENINFIRSDHSRFWFVNHPQIKSMSAVLISDTGPARGQMRKCYHKDCDSARSPHTGDFANFDFYAFTLQVLVNTIVELSESECQIVKCPSPLTQLKSSGKSVTSSMGFMISILTVITFSLSRMKAA